MSTSIAELRKSKSSIEALLKAATPEKKLYKNDKTEVWSCKGDQMGNGSAVIRFMPAPKGESVPWAKMFSFGFKNPVTNRWYIQNSLSTLGLTDPMKEFNDTLYATKDVQKIAQAKTQKQKLSYYANVLIVNDPTNPENNGTVQLFRFGQKIFDKIIAAMQPDNTGLEPDDWKSPIDPFCAFEGVNFTIKMKKLKGYANFDDSGFSVRSKPIAETDEAISALWDQCKSLGAITANDKFKSYDDLKKEVDKVFGGSAPKHVSTVTQSASETADDIGEEFDTATKQSSPPPWEDSDDDLDYFKNLAND